MNKKIIGLIVGVLLLFGQGRVAFAEENFDYNRAYEDYIFTLEQYRQAHSEYLLARAQYMQSGTLTAQTKARDATVAMLETRDDVIATYLTALRMRLNEAPGIDPALRDGLSARLDVDVNWFLNHKSGIHSAGTLEDLISDSNQAKDYFELTRNLNYEVLQVISMGKVANLREQVIEPFTKLKIKVAEFSANNGFNSQVVDRWIIETDYKLTRSQEKYASALSLLASLQNPKEKDKYSVYNNALFRLQESLQYLDEANQFVQEILRGVKRKA